MHDPREHIRNIHQLLISDKKKIGFLFGAGTSFSTGIDINIPAVAKMTELVLEEVTANFTKFKTTLDEIRKEIEDDKVVFHIESLLSSIEAKRAIIGKGKLNGLNYEGFTELATELKKSIERLVLKHKELSFEQIDGLAHSKLSSWISRGSRSFPVEIFTTNYDYLLEMAFEHHRVPLFDGFSGSYKPFFCPEAVEDVRAFPDVSKLWKLHGSLNWQYCSKTKGVVRSETTEAETMLIYPSHLKYDTAKKEPYVSLIDRLHSFLQQDDTILIVCGFSFGDNHINERIASALKKGGNSHVIAMYFDEYWDDDKKRYALSDKNNAVRKMATHDTAGKMSVYGRRHAVIGGLFGEWRLKDEPSFQDSILIDHYFDEDATLPSDIEGMETEKWSGLGTFKLPDFCKLTDFLFSISSSTNN